MSTPQTDSDVTYSVYRFFQDKSPKELIRGGLTKAEKDAYFDEEETAGDGWFDGFYKDE